MNRVNSLWSSMVVLPYCFSLFIYTELFKIFLLLEMRKPLGEREEHSDLRVVFAADVVSQVLSKLAAPLGCSVAKSVSPPGFPKHPLCTADVVVYPSSAKTVLR